MMVGPDRHSVSRLLVYIGLLVSLSQWYYPILLAKSYIAVWCSMLWTIEMTGCMVF